MTKKYKVHKRVISVTILGKVFEKKDGVTFSKETHPADEIEAAYKAGFLEYTPDTAKAVEKEKKAVKEKTDATIQKESDVNAKKKEENKAKSKEEDKSKEKAEATK